MAFQVERGVVPPPEARNSHKLPDLAVGDSLFFPGASSSWRADKPRNPAFWAARMFYRRRGYKISIRTVEGGVRIWRVE